MASRAGIKFLLPLLTVTGCLRLACAKHQQNGNTQNGLD
jgi:hypothetical protein